ncbi:MAG: hypothetical protein HYZ36_06345 [Pedosphaera parvula]|nr:hypothetical protein [Pedosphaera parvula]
MKLLSRYALLAVVTAGLAFAPAVLAGECCKKTAAAVKKGEACEQCVKDACCKKTAAKLTKQGQAKECAKCAAKSKEKS